MTWYICIFTLLYIIHQLFNQGDNVHNCYYAVVISHNVAQLWTGTLDTKKALYSYRLLIENTTYLN